MSLAELGGKAGKAGKVLQRMIWYILRLKNRFKVAPIRLASYRGFGLGWQVTVTTAKLSVEYSTTVIPGLITKSQARMSAY
jgi:hypothetical protein